jgi:hypothetical protein
MGRLVNESRMDKTAFSSGSIQDEPHDREFWLSQSDTQRLAGIEFMRQVLYGYDPATARLQRVLEVAELGED